MSMLFALVLLGCADDGTACEPLASRPETYATKALCRSREEQALASDIALRADYPSVITRCLPRASMAGGHARTALPRRTR